MSILTQLSTATTTSWRAERPFLGGVLLIVAGLIVGYVPIQFTLELILVGGAYTAIGLLFAVLMFLTGVFALLRPDLSTILGIAGVAFSILSVVGALGGLLVGLLIGIVASNLLISWQPPESAGEPRAAATTVSKTPDTEGGGWQGKIGGAGLNAPTASSSVAPTTSEGSGKSFAWQEGTGRTTSPATRQGTGSGPDFSTGTGTTSSTGTSTTDTSTTSTTDTTAESPFESPDERSTEPDYDTSTSDEGSVDFGWQEDPDARSGQQQEDVGTSFDAERQPTMDEDTEEDEDEDEDDRLDFSWSED